MGIEVGVRTGILILCQNRVFVVVWKWLYGRMWDGPVERKIRVGVKHTDFLIGEGCNMKNGNPSLPTLSIHAII